MAVTAPAQSGFEEAETALTGGDLERVHDVIVPLAERGDARALNLLGVFYQNGWIVERDTARAAELYSAAADLGFARAIHNLGRLYRAGLGVEQDITRAAELWKEAGRMGYIRSQASLGALYHDGDGVPQDMFRAYFWWSLAAQRMDLEATRAREDIIYRLAPHQKDIADLLAERFEPDR